METNRYLVSFNLLVTVYTDSSCSVGAVALRPGECVSSGWQSFSYDCGS